jgi:uroporphyrinogen-III decarboxylase
MTSVIETREFLASLWKLEDVGRPAFQINVQVDSGTTMLERFNEPAKMLRHQLLEFEAKSRIADDFVPALFPYLGTAIFPSAFGCPVKWFDNQDPWAESIINDDPHKIYALSQPTVRDGLLGRVLEDTRYLREQTRGAYPIRMTDVQGPFDIAYLIWRHEDFMFALRESPQEVHHLLGMVTRLIIDFVKEQRRIAGEFIPCHYPPIWMPDGMGISISDDVMTLISPRHYETFVLPYINQLSDAFNGIFIHSCGNFTHQLANLEKVHNLRGIDFAVGEMPFAPVAERFAGKVVLSVRLGLDKERHFVDIPSWVEHVLRGTPTARGLFLSINTWYSSPESGRPWNETDLQRIWQMIRAE